jgi:hypothetical protein
MPISGSCGSFVGAPYRIVHHTTEGSSRAAAFQAFRAHRSDPHFTVDHEGIYQHIDTGMAARALRNLDGGVQTNRSNAVQIEVVGFAGQAKALPTLENVARLCRWLERTHGIPQAWPAGYPKHAVNGRDPGGHNRSAQIWAAHGGHYGHSQVPENIHWDPGYTEQEALFVLTYNPDMAGLGEPDPEMEALRESFPLEVELHDDPNAIHDHSDVEGSDAACPPTEDEEVPE